MPDLFPNTGVPLLDILSRAGGSLMKPKFEDKYGEDIKGIDAIQEPDARMQKISEVADRAMADGYSLPERRPLTTRTNQIIDETLKPGTPAAIMQAARYTQMMGRVPKAGNSMGGLNTMAEILQRGSVANYNAGPRTTQALTAAGRNVEQAGQAKAGATRNLAQAGLAGTRAGDITATQPGRIALTGEQTDLANARAQRALTPRAAQSFHVIVKNPVTGKDDQMLYDTQGNFIQRLGEAPGRANEFGDLAEAFADPEGYRARMQGRRTGAQVPGSPPPAAPQGAGIQLLRQLGYTDEQLRAEGLIQKVPSQAVAIPAPAAQAQGEQFYLDPQGNRYRRTDPNAPIPSDWVLEK